MIPDSVRALIQTFEANAEHYRSPAQTETRHADLMSRRERRRRELERQRALSLQAVQRIASVLVLPHPERQSPDVGRQRPATREDMIGGVRSYLRSTQRQPAVVRSYFQAESVRYAAG